MGRHVTDTIWNFLSTIEQTVRRLSDGTPQTRLIVCALAVLILFVRIPSMFHAPEFWAEDGILISDAYNKGWMSLLAPIEGAYYNFYGNLAANIAVQFPPRAWPWLAIYAAHAGAILTVFLVTSPRFDFPYRALAALAVVAVPMYDIFGGLANAQWVLALAVFILPLLRAGPRWMLVPEAVLAFIVGLEGPFVAFVLPVYAWRLWTCEAGERPRLIVLAAIGCCCAAIQILTIAHSSPFNLIEPKPYDHIVWLIMPIRWFDSIRLAGIFINHKPVAVALVIGGAAAATWFAFRQPHRIEKVAMLMFATLILYSGLYKYRAFIEFFSNDRYLFSGAVFAFWFFCLVAAPPGSRRSLIIVPAIVVLLIWNPIRRSNQFDPEASVVWASQAARIGNGPIEVPIAPGGPWAIRLER